MIWGVVSKTTTFLKMGENSHRRVTENRLYQKSYCYILIAFFCHPYSEWLNKDIEIVPGGWHLTEVFSVLTSLRRCCLTRGCLEKIASEVVAFKAVASEAAASRKVASEVIA